MQKIEIKCTGTSSIHFEELNIFQGNLKRLTNENLERLKHSMITRGFCAPFFIFENDGIYNILDGTSRKKALISLKEDGYEIPELPVVFIDADSEEEARQKLLSITSSYAEFDIDELSSWLDEFDEDIADSFRFVDTEIDFDFDEEPEETEGDDEISEDIENGVTKLGDLWELGDHRVLCGDSTKEESYKVLMNEQKAGMIHTDPPYNIDYEGGSKKREKIKNDKLEDFNEFLFDVYTRLFENCYPGACIYVWHASTETHNFIIEFLNAGFLFKSYIVWNKNNSTFGRSDYHWKHEPAVYGWAGGGSHKWFGDRKQSTVWDINRPNRSDEHPTMKPIELCERAIINSSGLGMIVLDAFLGSGSTLIACEKTNRICYGMELDEHYCDVIVKRYIDWCQKNNHEITVKLNGEDFDYLDM